MSKCNGRKVKLATLHGPIHVPDIGQLGPKLSNFQNGVDKAVDMVIDEPFLMIYVKGRLASAEVPIPLANVSHMVLVPEEKA